MAKHTPKKKGRDEYPFRDNRLLGETADILRENAQLVDMEELWLEGPAVVDEGEPEEKRLIFLN